MTSMYIVTRLRSSQALLVCLRCDVARTNGAKIDSMTTLVQKRLAEAVEELVTSDHGLAERLRRALGRLSELVSVGYDDAHPKAAAHLSKAMEFVGADDLHQLEQKQLESLSREVLRAYIAQLSSGA